MLTGFHKRHGGTLTPVASGQGSLTRVIPTMCQLEGHTDQALAMYCFTCKKPICVMCGLLALDHGGHNGHNVQVTSKAVDVCLADLDKVHLDAQAQTRTLQQAITEMQAAIAQLSAKRSAADLKIDATHNEVRSCVPTVNVVPCLFSKQYRLVAGLFQLRQLRDQVEASRVRSKNEIKAHYNSKIKLMRNHVFMLQQHHDCLASVAKHAAADRQLPSKVQMLVACTELVVRSS